MQPRRRAQYLLCCSVICVRRPPAARKAFSHAATRQHPCLRGCNFTSTAIKLPSLQVLVTTSRLFMQQITGSQCRHLPGDKTFCLDTPNCYSVFSYLSAPHRCRYNNTHRYTLLNYSRVYFNILYSQHWSPGISYSLT